MKWQDIYTIGNILGFRVIIRNQWHPFYGGANFELLQIGRIYHYDSGINEVVFGLFGFQLSARKSSKWEPQSATPAKSSKEV